MNKNKKKEGRGAIFSSGEIRKKTTWEKRQARGKKKKNPRERGRHNFNRKNHTGKRGKLALL